MAREPEQWEKNRKQKTENRKQKMKSKAWQEHGKGMARAYAMQCNASRQAGWQAGRLAGRSWASEAKKRMQCD